MSRATAAALAAANLAAFLAFGWDKIQAIRSGRRLPETTLCLLAAVGGAAGAWVGVVVFRHKTRKPAFLLELAVATAASFVWLGLARIRAD
ncbi:MAG: DUF1294 domain-containing protein [Planctomycetota bacterium]|nr:MAG: DUF1294 domain-containing protein [Planctomycetota bacterium]